MAELKVNSHSKLVLSEHAKLLEGKGVRRNAKVEFMRPLRGLKSAKYATFNEFPKRVE